MRIEINSKKALENYMRIKKELPNAIIAYAIKANYDQKILELLAKNDCLAEVCSEYEHKIAIKNGFKKIIRNGYAPKGTAWLTNVETIEDRTIIKGLIGARLRLDTKSKLGIDESEILKNRWDAVAIHTREDFENSLKKAETIADKTGAQYIDAGGNYNTEKIQILKRVKHELIIEPGREIVANTTRIITKVLAIKENKIITDCGMNLLNKFADNKYIVNAKGTKNHTYKIYGPIPTELDNIGTH
ncbi:MAG TPA: hypothetical protein VI790_05690, partial [Candidatus Nanoarchaeia archaeon]|nr:hypothetical protein [Candidatus Nanoarchaeia archaeon]